MMALNGQPKNLKDDQKHEDKDIFNSLERQTVYKVVDFSSQYGGDLSKSYTVHNVVGEACNYPSYGDFTQTLVFRTYGIWWNQSPSTPKSFTYKNLSFTSRDFVDIEYREEVYPTEVEIFETYNPGAVVRILACNSNAEITNVYDRWFVLWCGKIQRCRHKARVFTPKLKKCPFKTRRIRLEFNQDHLEYYTEIDAVYLHGLVSEEEYYNDKVDSIDSLKQDFANLMTDKNFWNETKKDQELPCWNILSLPIEVIIKIFSYLTFADFGNLSRSCSSFRDYCYDPLWFKEFDLQPYWQKINKFTLQFLSERCQSSEKLRLSWCGSNDMLFSSDFSSFFQKVSGKLRSLYLSCCRFVDSCALELIASTCPQLEELDLSSCVHIPTDAFETLANLRNLEKVNLYRTQITEVNFIKIARSCTKLMHVNLGGCFRFKNFDEATKCLSYCPNVVSLDLWRAVSLTPRGVHNISINCPNLEEIDLGWCKNIAAPECLRDLVTRCRKLRKIFLTALRTVCDDDLIAISENCLLLEHLDILGTSFVSKKSAERILYECKHLKFFDVSFCSQLDYEWYVSTKDCYPQVSLKKSIQHMQNELQ